MFFSLRRYAFLIVSSTPTMGLLTPATRAQHGRAMNGGSMQSSRPSGMMSRPRSTFPGGFGLNAYRTLGGMGRRTIRRLSGDRPPARLVPYLGCSAR